MRLVKAVGYKVKTASILFDWKQTSEKPEISGEKHFSSSKLSVSDINLTKHV